MTVGRQQGSQGKGNSQKTCSECGSDHLITDPQRAEVICRNCGLVQDEEMFDTGPDVPFDTKKMGSGLYERTGGRGLGPPSTRRLHNKGLSTIIDWRNRDIFRKDISSTIISQVYRMRNWQKRIINYNDRALAFANREIEGLCSHLRLGEDIQEEACRIYRICAEKKIVRGRPTESMAAAIVYRICRERKVPRTLDEIAEHSVIDKKEIGRSYSHMCRELKIRIITPKAEEYISRFASKLDIGAKVQTRARDILEKAYTMGLNSGKGPKGLVAAALYIAGILEDERRTQGDISKAIKVTEVTLRHRYTEFDRELELGLRENDLI